MTAHKKPWLVHVRNHPGSSKQDIANEPDWGRGHQHRVGFRNKRHRVPGFAHDGNYSTHVRRARELRKELIDEETAGRLVNFRDLDLHLRHPENRSLGWRYVIDATEDWVKNKQRWPANIQREKKKEQERVEKESKQEHEWRRDSDKDKHHDAYATGDGHQEDGDDKNSNGQVSGDSEMETEAERLERLYSPQELALLRALEHEKNYMSSLKENDGKGKSPQHRNRTQISIDEQDQFSPDNWIPRSSHLMRITGKHPLNGEPKLDDLYEGGLITPNELHYIRNHGAVPRLLWEFHKLDIEYNGKKHTLTMPQLTTFETTNIPVALACDGNRRKELNMIKRSKGFNWGPGAISCAYWKGPLVRDVLLDAHVPEVLPGMGRKRYWVNFEGADDLSDGAYSTCLPFDYVMNPQNDVLLAHKMNDLPLPPDHGYPVRVIVPGYVGGRNVKWLRRIWISEEENNSHYHIWDNRVLPSFVTEMDGPFAETLFRHPDTACNEQNLNSIIVKPAHGETISLAKISKGQNYRLEGIAYDGGGHEVQRVEVSLDDGKTWLYCIRTFPDSPIRHGNKYWAWIHWHVDVKMQHLLRASSITVRCFNVFKNTQPRDPVWNIMGMMNNGWYVVKPELAQAEHSGEAQLLFRHPTEPGQGTGGWMKPSVENQIAEAKQEAGAPQKEFTREEIEKHSTQDDCWIVVDGKVYDATSVLDWHPGGAAAIMSHAGAVHQETTDEFSSIHDDYAHEKLKECALGVVTEKAANYIKKNAESAAKQDATSQDEDKVALQNHRWVPVTLAARKDISEDSRTYTFQLPKGQPNLGLGTCQHILLGFHLMDRMLIRSYTPTRPLCPPHDGGKQHTNAAGRPLEDGSGTFDLTVKTYFPDGSQPGGAMSTILDCVPLGEQVEVRGPTGEIVYHSDGVFEIESRRRRFRRVSLVLGGSGVTPGYALLARIAMSGGDRTEVRVLDANKTERDILLREEMAEFARGSGGRIRVTHVLSHPEEDGGWDGLTGYVDEEKIRGALFPPGEDSVALLCGPPAMIQKAALPALKSWGYVEDENLFGF
ncbi:Oxidoreductase, molybdopterin-binding domain protein [Cordyceps fumosorosea ARSEF 2679]|uniref:Nitrate reductase [NADPH] n=1 Tax=Cordyceps fumosorosea (strain ARSEF 2679) TaxID=1081104 RepID=A0A167NJP2_CORFA|nr:Oxidoreductase, molybdopterin-binding domain protein [Cordyceps fumosorosea ARSEF 2679]OAA55621.1 Oxidoreductase, molybdopterin-binding domain protein [Cordyceps fumosorosea ARSEF 2679]